MSKAVTVEQQSLLPAEEQPNMLQVIARAAASPDVDVAKMQALLDMQFQLQARQAELDFNAALTRIQTKMPRIQQRGTTKLKTGAVMSRYALYEDIDKVVRPMLAEEGMVFTFLPEISDKPKHTRVKAVLRHTAGHSIQAVIDLPQDESGAKNELQGRGSAMAYAKRYLITQILNIVSEGNDTDGNDLSLINEQQAMQLEDMLQATGSKADFLKWIGATEVRGILQRDFPKAVAGLKAKLAGAKKNA